jgi:peptidoglycan/LPS O-acetylase OafA/YrhL
MSASLTFGHQAVLLFFLISGFCIHYRQARSLARSGDGHMNLKSYTWRRLRRLYPPLLLALALTALFDSLGASLNPAYYAGQTAYPSINDAAVAGSRTLTTLFGGLFFQSGLATSSFGTNGPLWSLSYEFWFYALYPLLLVVSGRLGAWLMAALAIGTSAIALLATQIGFLPMVPVWVLVVLSYWVVWACGALIAEAYVGRIRIPYLRWIAPIGALAVVYLAGSSALKRLDPSTTLDSPARDLQWGIALAVLLAFGMLSAPAWLARIAVPGRRILAPLGAISYSLYVVHFPWLALISAWWLSWHERLPLGAELAIPGALSALVLAVLSWYFVERHFMTHKVQVRSERTAVVNSSAAAIPEPVA